MCSKVYVAKVATASSPEGLQELPACPHFRQSSGVKKILANSMILFNALTIRNSKKLQNFKIENVKGLLESIRPPPSDGDWAKWLITRICGSETKCIPPSTA